jgi:hypothetical protein
MTKFDPHAAKNARIAALKAQSSSASKESELKEDAITQRTQLIKPEDATERIRIIFDNSVSMDANIGAFGDSPSRIEEAKKGVVEYLRNCQLNRDAVAVHFLNNYTASHIGESTLPASILQKSELTTDLILLASSIDDENVRARGGTPLFEITEITLDATPIATRIIMFSDGAPNNCFKKESCIEKAIEKKIPIDTVYIGLKGESRATLLQEIAERTNGIFIVIDASKGADFKTAFKYLAPTKRLMLMDKSFKEKIERGEVK